jgi:hypothetical protein
MLRILAGKDTDKMAHNMSLIILKGTLANDILSDIIFFRVLKKEEL